MTMPPLDLDRLEELAKKAVATEGKTRYCLEMEFQDEVTPEGFLALIERLRRAEKERDEADAVIAWHYHDPSGEDVSGREEERWHAEALARHAERIKP